MPLLLTLKFLKSLPSFTRLLFSPTKMADYRPCMSCRQRTPLANFYADGLHCDDCRKAWRRLMNHAKAQGLNEELTFMRNKRLVMAQYLLAMYKELYAEDARRNFDVSLWMRRALAVVRLFSALQVATVIEARAGTASILEHFYSVQPRLAVPNVDRPLRDHLDLPFSFTAGSASGSSSAVGSASGSSSADSSIPPPVGASGSSSVGDTPPSVAPDNASAGTPPSAEASGGPSAGNPAPSVEASGPSAGDPAPSAEAAGGPSFFNPAPSVEASGPSAGPRSMSIVKKRISGGLCFVEETTETWKKTVTTKKFRFC